MGGDLINPVPSQPVSESKISTQPYKQPAYNQGQLPTKESDLSSEGSDQVLHSDDG